MNLLESLDGWARVRLPDAQEGWVVLEQVRPATPVQTAGAPDGQAGAASDQSSRIAQLESALAAAAVERAQLQRGTSALRNELYELILANEQSEATAAANAASDFEANRRMGEIEDALASAEAEARAASAEATRLEAKLASFESEAERHRSDWEAERLQLVEATSILQSEVVELGAANERLEAEVALRLVSESEASRRVKALEEALEVVEAERTALERGNAELRTEIGALREMNEGLASAAVTVAEPSASVEAEERLAVLEAVLGTTEAERLSFEQAMVELRNEIGQLREANEGLALAAVEGPGPKPVQVQQRSADPPVVRKPLTPEHTEVPSYAAESTAMIEAWARAWSEQRVEDYLVHYSTRFEPADGSSRRQWEGLRRLRVSRPEHIDVRVALADLRALDEERVEVVFLQSYESNLMADVVLKTLDLVREDDGWRIAGERVDQVIKVQ